LTRKLTVAFATATALAVSAAPALAAEDGNTFNNQFTNGSDPISQCITARVSSGIAAFSFNNTYLPFSISTANDVCGGGRLRILRLQALTIDGRRTYVLRGHTNQRHVHVSGSDLASTPSLLSHSVRNGNGRAAASCPWPMYVHPVGARNMPSDMLYKKASEIDPSGDHLGAAWRNYGNPGWWQTGGKTDYTYLLWNLPRRATGGTLPGGGLIMANLKQDHPIQLCDVSQLRLPSFAPNTDNQNGFVQFAYGRATNGHETIYGWWMTGYDRWDGAGFIPTYHW